MRKKLKIFHRTGSSGRPPKRHYRLKRLWRHPAMLAVATFAVLAVGGAAAFVFINGGQPKFKPITSYIVIVSHDHQQQTVPTNEPTVGALLAKLHIQLHTGDVVEPSRATQIDEDNFRVNIYRAVPVEIIDGQTKTFTFSAAVTPRSIVEQAGIKVYPEDYVSAAPVANFASQQSISKQIVINRATPVDLNVYGTPTIVRTHAKTVDDLLAEKHIALAAGDNFQPAGATPITSNLQIFLIHHGTEIQTQTQNIPAPVQTVQDSSLTLGTSAVRQAGSAGSELVTYEVATSNGVAVSRTPIQTVITQPAVTRIIAVGTASLGGSLQTWLYKLRTCESGGNYQDNTGNGYYGAYQFSLSTWESLGYSGLPSNASPETQDTAIIQNTERSGLASQNPGCYYSTGISDYPPSQ